MSQKNRRYEIPVAIFTACYIQNHVMTSRLDDSVASVYLSTLVHPYGMDGAFVAFFCIVSTTDVRVQMSISSLIAESRT